MLSQNFLPFIINNYFLESQCFCLLDWDGRDKSCVLKSHFTLSPSASPVVKWAVYWILASRMREKSLPGLDSKMVSRKEVKKRQCAFSVFSSLDCWQYTQWQTLSHRCWQSYKLQETRSLNDCGQNLPFRLTFHQPVMNCDVCEKYTLLSHG